jgi:uncharacterized protein
MPINVNDITSAEWSLSTRGQGEVEQGFDDINQCIKLIVSTQRGTDPMRPNFGCDLWRFMDYGINVAAARMTNEILSALATWETRIEVTNINYSTLEESVTFNILWILQGNKQRGSASITLDFAPQRQTEAPPVIIAPIDVPVLSAVYTYPDGVLSWTFPSPIGVSFQILRSANGGALEQIATAVGVLGYTDLDLDFDTLYTYQIRAVKGSRVSAFSNSADIQTLEPYIEFASSAPLYLDIQKTGTADLIESAGGISKVYLLGNDPEVITAFLADDAGDDSLNAGITGILDLGDAYSGLRTIRARSQDFTLLAGTWVRNASVNIDVSNSVISLDRITALIDNIILANGGTITDNGTSYTGVPGETHASRILGIGSLVIDITAPENAILYEKVEALKAVGWTITIVETVCEKTRVFNTDSQDFAAWTVDSNFFEIIGITTITADSLIVAYYDNITNAIAGTATGRLALGQTAVNSYLSATGWSSGEAIRIYSGIGSINQSAELTYKATPLAGVPCGLQSAPYIAGNAKVYDGVFDSDSVASWTEFDTTQPFTILGALDIDSLKTCRIFSTRRLVSGNNKGFQHGFVADGRIFAGFVGNGIGTPRLLQIISNTGDIKTGLISYAITFDGGGNVLGAFTMKINNSVISANIDSNLLVGDTVTNGTGTAKIGDTNIVGNNSKFDGLIRKFQILDTDYSQTPALQAILDEALQVGSFEGLVDDARFLLDPDFNKTSGNLTTRSGTPTYSITANGGEAYTKFIP